MQHDMESIVRQLIEALGEDPTREGLVDTPRRVSKSLQFLTRGYFQTVEEIVNGALFEAHSRHMVIVKDIEIYSMCEHHLLPFIGRCHIGYIPRDKVIGVSKLARIADMYARRLQIQERLTQQIADAIMDVLKPLGVGVVVEAQHLCMMMRGVEKQNSFMITSAVLGCFQDSLATRTEFFKLLERPSLHS